jgi:uncharacterized protein
VSPPGRPKGSFRSAQHEGAPVSRVVYGLLAIVGVGYAGICAALFVFQRSLIYFPQPRMVTSPESTMRLRVEGAELVVSIKPHAGPRAIVYFGGNAEDVSVNLQQFDAWFPDHALFLLHYRGYGGSTGMPTEQSNHADAAALFEKVRAEHPEVVVIGRSLGSGVAVRLASVRPVSRLILVTPYDSIEAIAAAQYPYVPVRWLLRDKYDSAAYAPSIKSPTAIIAAENDEAIPRASTDKLYARFATGVASMTVIAGTGHNTIQNSTAYRAALQAAL